MQIDPLADPPSLASQPDPEPGSTFCTAVDGRLASESRRNSGIPPALIPFIRHAPDSPTYRCLAGAPPRLDQSMSKTVVSDLYRYLTVAVDNDLIGEAVYIQSIIDSVRADKIFLKLNVDQSIADLDRRIEDASAALNNRLA
jgi:hypothetical protein